MIYFFPARSFSYAVFWHRALTLGLQGSENVTWAEALQPENILSHVLWVTENTLNPQLIEKVPYDIFDTFFPPVRNEASLFSYVSLSAFQHSV